VLGSEAVAAEGVGLSGSGVIIAEARSQRVADAHAGSGCDERSNDGLQ
jgi:hypothetical protein